MAFIEEFVKETIFMESRFMLLAIFNRALCYYFPTSFLVAQSVGVGRFLYNVVRCIIKRLNMAWATTKVGWPHLDFPPTAPLIELFEGDTLQRKVVRILTSEINELTADITLAQRSPEYEMKAIEFLLGDSKMHPEERGINCDVFRKVLEYAELRFSLVRTIQQRHRGESSCN